MTIYAESLGGIFRFTKRSWLKYCKAMAENPGETSVDDYGKFVCIVDHYMTAWNVADFRVAARM